MSVTYMLTVTNCFFYLQKFLLQLGLSVLFAVCLLDITAVMSEIVEWHCCIVYVVWLLWMWQIYLLM